MWAAYVGNAGTLTALLDSGANLKTRNNVRNWTRKSSDKVNLSMLYLTSAVTPVLLFFKSFILTSSVIQIFSLSFTLSHFLTLFLYFLTHTHTHTHTLGPTFSVIHNVLSVTVFFWLFHFFVFSNIPVFFSSSLLLFLFFHLLHFFTFHSSPVIPINSYHLYIFCFFFSSLLFLLLLFFPFSSFILFFFFLLYSSPFPLFLFIIYSLGWKEGYRFSRDRGLPNNSTESRWGKNLQTFTTFFEFSISFFI